MAVITVPAQDDADILGWTRESVEGSPVAAWLRPLFEVPGGICSFGSGVGLNPSLHIYSCTARIMNTNC